jgi:methyl-accepting chemotaxis protein
MCSMAERKFVPVQGARPFLRVLGLLHGKDALPDALLAAQLTTVRKNVPETMIASVFAMLVVIGTNYASPQLWIIVVCGLGLSAVCVGNLLIWQRQRAGGWSFDNPRRAVLQTARLALLLSLSWGILLAATLIDAPSDRLLLMVCVIVGVTAAGVLNVAAVPLASAAFLLGSMIMIAVDVLFLALIPNSVFALLAVFVFILIRSVMGQSSLFIEHFETSQELLAASREQEAMAASAQAERERAALSEANTRQAAGHGSARGTFRTKRRRGDPRP